jgi:peptide/nickel transport system substrate-binding protein
MKHRTENVRAAVIIAMLLVPILFIACGGGEPQIVDTEVQDEPEFAGLVDIDHEGGWETGRKGGRLVMSATNDPKTFNHIVADETSTTDITERLLGAAVRRNQFTLEWEPWLAETWDISEDQRTITYTLRDDIFWSDGEPITADDFVGTVNEIYYNEEVTSAGSTRNSLRNAGGDSIWTVIDERTFMVELPSVYAGIFSLTSVAPMPMHVFRPLIAEEGAGAIDSFWGVDTDVSEIVSGGPWIISSYTPSQRISLAPNPYYYETDDAGTRLPYLDEVVIEIVPDQDTQLQRLLGGEINYLAIRGEDYGVLVNDKESLGIELYNVGPSTSTNFIAFNQNPIEGESDAGISEPELTWLSNKTFRTAMAHLVDRETYIQNFAFGFGYPQFSFVPTFSPYYWDGAVDAAPKFDPDAAADLLDSIDYIDRDGDGYREDPDGNRISLTLATNSDSSVRVQIMTQFAQDAAEVGIEIVENAMDFNALVGQLVASYDWNMVVIGLTGSIDPISGVNVYPSDGNLHMIEPNQESPRRDWERRVDDAWVEANLTTDEAQRERGFQTIQETWIDEAPWVFTYNAAIMHAYSDSLGNIFPHPTEDYDWEGILHRLYFAE